MDMNTAIYNLGSLNIDRVFRVDHIVRPGETIAARSVATFAGGKGANQSVALARAGAHVIHVGCVGADGRHLVERLESEGVDTRFVRTTAGLTGQAIIQVDDRGENSIVLSPGANNQVAPADVDRALANATAGNWLVVQNETSAVEHAIRAAYARGMRIALNPAPLDDRAREYPLELVHLLCVNETESLGLIGQDSTTFSSHEQRLAALRERTPGHVLLTLGDQGAWLDGPAGAWRQDAVSLGGVVDTTAAGDTFFGYFLAAFAAGVSPALCLERACRAAGLCVTRPGAMDSIPFAREIATR
jgi:ribokinase